MDEDDWEDCHEAEEEVLGRLETELDMTKVDERIRRRSSIICPIYNVSLDLYLSIG